MKTRTVISVIAISVIAVLLLGVFGSRPTQTREILYEGETLDVLVANDALEHRRGLSGIELEDLNADGMLFVFNEQKERNFWMNDMRFDLDVVWIRDKRVVKIQKGIPAPEAGEDPEHFYSTPHAVDAVLELPAGHADRYGFIRGTFFSTLLDE